MKTQTAAAQTASNRRIMPIPTAALAKGRLKNETQNIYPALPDYILADLIRSLLQPSGRPTRTPAAGSFRRPVRRMVAGTRGCTPYCPPGRQARPPRCCCGKTRSKRVALAVLFSAFTAWLRHSSNQTHRRQTRPALRHLPRHIADYRK